MKRKLNLIIVEDFLNMVPEVKHKGLAKQNACKERQ